jgi:hypothetical protein
MLGLCTTVVKLPQTRWSACTGKKHSEAGLPTVAGSLQPTLARTVYYPQCPSRSSSPCRSAVPVCRFPIQSGSMRSSGTGSGRSLTLKRAAAAGGFFLWRGRHFQEFESGGVAGMCRIRYVVADLAMRGWFWDPRSCMAYWLAPLPQKIYFNYADDAS